MWWDLRNRTALSIQYDIVTIVTTVVPCTWELIVPYHTNVSRIYCELKVFTMKTMCKTFIRRHLLEKLDDKIFWRFFFTTVGGGIKKNTTIPTKARKESKKNLLFIDWNTPQPTNSLLCCYYNHFLVTMLVSGIGHAPGTWKGWLYAYSLGTSICVQRARKDRLGGLHNI